MTENCEYAIQVQDVSKIYRLYEKPIDRLKESLSPTHKSYHRDFFALSNISFQVKKGETVGIIGTNGSGKSTILKIITGVLTPTTGNVRVSGVISALLELGAGFNMDYTGIENVYMNGTMMGFTRSQMDEKLPEILEFADIGDFVYQPVKTYSSGMFVRLAFALAINVEPEILIVDEALSVGDVFFQSKCYRRMEEIRKQGTTILMVTHDMGSVIKYCDRVVLLNKGHYVAEGPAGKMVDLYKKILANQMDALEEELAEGMQGAGHDDHHDHDDPHDHDHDDGHEDEVEYDEHIWTSPRIAMGLCRAIAETMQKADPEHAQNYARRLETYLAELSELDQAFTEVVADGTRHMVVFGDRFPLLYFCKTYGLEYRAAFHGCAGDTEPSLATLKYLIDKVQEEGIPVVYTIELSSRKVAQAIAETTGAKVLTFQSCQTVSRQDFDAGATYLSLMRQNVAALKEGLA